MRNKENSKVTTDHIEAKVCARVYKDAGRFPNSYLPVILYQACRPRSTFNPEELERLFDENNWRGSWRNGIYNYHHYHSTSHEVLGVFKGSAKVQLGGDGGTSHDLRPGDVLVIPAGVAHKNLGSTSDFAIVGAYPDGMQWDLNCGKPGERPRTDQNIARVPLPKFDPVYGSDGPLISYWALAARV